ncbi:MAG: tetratricopeptide repeat protein, partial [Acidobacteriia bacterium]|nr:tetratricopeptide repeat protein [Terriglobia bacterium]
MIPLVRPDGSAQPPAPASDRLDSWKEIAVYLKRGARTVQRWEREEGLPVHRLQHDKLGSIYAYKTELDAWWTRRGAELDEGAPAPSASARTVAVLPFADMSQEKDHAYFCEGVAEEIINALSRVHGLRVASRTSSFPLQASCSDPREIGRRLRVGALLGGSVRKSGGRLRIAVQLTGAENGFQLWSGRYDREMSDIFAIQDEIAESVVRALEVTLTQTEATALRKPRTTDVRAYDSYLRGRSYYYQYSPKSIEFALQMFMRALEIDESYAQAYAGLADCWSYVYLYSKRSDVVRGQADWASRKALELDPNCASAQASRGLCLSLDGEREEAERAFQRAMELDPGLFEAYYFHARHSFAQGRLEEAVHYYEQASRVNPDDYQALLLAAQSYESLSRPGDADAARRKGIEIAERRIQLNPDDARALYMAANGLVAIGERERGRQAAERARSIRPDDPMLL